MNNEALQPDLLEAFKAVVETKSFSRAAVKLRLAQSSVSNRISRLEKSLGRRLLDRNTHDVNITLDGEAMLMYANVILSLHEQVRHHFSRSEVAGTISIGLSAGIRATPLTIVVSKLQHAYPHLHVSILTGANDHLLSLFDGGDLDIVIGIKSAGQGRGEVLAVGSMSWFGDPLLIGDKRSPIPLAITTEPSLLRRLTLQSLATARRSWVIKLESDSLDALSSAVLGGLGVTAAPRCLLAADVPILNTADMPRIPPVDLFLEVQPSAASYIQLLASMLRDHLPTPHTPAVAPGSG